VLYRAVLSRLGVERVHPGHHLVRCGQDNDGQAWGEFVDRATDVPIGLERPIFWLAATGSIPLLGGSSIRMKAPSSGTAPRYGAR
jgi:hypothetical protein